MVTKFEIEKLDIDRSGERYYLFDDADNPVDDVNAYVGEYYGDNLNTQARVIYALKDLYEFLDYKYIHPSHLTHSDYLEFRKWIKTDREYRGDIKEKKRGNLHRNTRLMIEDEVRRYFKGYIKGKYGLAFEFPKIRKRKYSDPKSKAIPIADFIRLLMYMNKRDRLLNKFLYESGLRIGELFNVSREDFENVPRSGTEEIFYFNVYDFGNRDQRKHSKTGFRRVWIRTKLAEEIQHYILFEREENRRKHLDIFTSIGFAKSKNGKTVPGDPLTYDAIYNSMKVASKKAGVEISPHRHRHSYATNQLVDGASEKEVQVQMGHAHLTTISIYSKGIQLHTSSGALEATRGIGKALDNLEVDDG